MTKSSELLRRAKDYLWDGVSPMNKPNWKSIFICFAIRDAALPKEGYEYSKLKNEITRRLKPFQMVYTWLHERAKIPGRDLTYKNIQAYRHRWLDALIAEYEVKGD
jgi:hypothetical protein